MQQTKFDMKNLMPEICVCVCVCDIERERERERERVGSLVT